MEGIRYHIVCMANQIQKLAGSNIKGSFVRIMAVRPNVFIQVEQCNNFTSCFLTQPLCKGTVFGVISKEITENIIPFHLGCILLNAHPLLGIKQESGIAYQFRLAVGVLLHHLDTSTFSHRNCLKTIQKLLRLWL